MKLKLELSAGLHGYPHRDSRNPKSLTSIWDRFVALTGEGEQELRLGMTVVLLGDSRGYVPSGFSPGDEVTIVGFTEPFENGETDHIVEVSNKSARGLVKPSNIQRNIRAW